MIRSFRIRLALLSALISGLTLAAFGLGSWWLIRELKLERLGTEVRFYAEREAPHLRSSGAWNQTAESLSATLGIRDRHDLILWVEGEGEAKYRSPHWPTSLDPTHLPWSQLENTDRNRERTSSVVVSQFMDGQLWRISMSSVGSSRLVLAVDARVIQSDMDSIRNAFLIALPFALAFIGVAGWVFARKALGPIQKLTTASRNVTAQGLDQRIDSVGEDREFVVLIEVFNGMLERLERSFQQAHRFSADAAHELKTPLAIVQGQLERAINMAEDASPIQRELTSILDETRRLSTISRKLLLLSQADAGRLNIFGQQFDLSDALRDLLEDTRMLAPHLTVEADIPPGLAIVADASLIRQVLHNLISNAIKYNIQGGRIHISGAKRDNHVDVVVTNTSHGIPSSDAGKIFERFYRVDAAHSRLVDGVGLGLSVSREIARAHRGELSLQTNEAGMVAFVLSLPVKQTESAVLEP
jgi:heavy metal sensor kinase